ncbi:protein kinase [Streptomyces sp. NPDC058001]|uniref:protein kinase n=1 Tax=Streptomyces sp. NPDC058001 TaxID=3346300 RepID=UPI0036E63271
MDDYAGRVLADRYRLPLPPSDAYEPSYTRAFDTYSGQEVHVRQVPLPEIVEAEVLDADGLPEGFVHRDGVPPGGGAGRGAWRGGPGTAGRSGDPAVRRAIEAAQAAAQIPDHPRLDQVFDVFAEGGSLWIVSELVPARPLSALLTDAPLTPYRAAEVAADVLTALRVLHAHGWVHRNITVRTVLICDDGRVMLTGLAAGAAEEALCGYDPRPETDADGVPDAGPSQVNAPPTPGGSLPAARGAGGGALTPRLPSPESDARAARAGAIAAYRAGARAAARVNEEQRGGGSGGLPEGLTPTPSPEPDRADPHGRITDPYGVRRPPGTWHGALPRGGSAAALPPGSAVPGSAGGNGPAPVPVPPASVPAGGPVPQWDVPNPRRGPATALAADRARQARMAVVGPVTERWAPEQAGPVHDNWQLAAPIGPATDLWALGALLFRAVQGHAPYPEDSTTELVQLVCAEPPAFAEECGPLRPVVESLLRQDPTERPDFEELRGWLRSLVRSAPEAEAGNEVIVAPPADPRRLPILRRRGELVRRRRSRASRASAGAGHHGRHKRAGTRADAGMRGGGGRSGTGRSGPAKLGRTLLVLILLGLVAAVAYAVVFMPKADTSERTGATGATGGVSPTPGRSSDSGTGAGAGAGETPAGDGGGDAKPSKSPGSQKPQTTGPDLPRGFTLRKDSEGFQVAVASGWDRSPKNGQGQVVYSKGDFELIVVPGRDSTKVYGSDPMTYQREREAELQPFRDSTWATSSGMRRIEVGGRAMAEGQFTWQDAQGRTTYVRNIAMNIAGRYHVLQVRGPDAERDEVSRLYEQASATYEPTN